MINKKEAFQSLAHGGRKRPDHDGPERSLRKRILPEVHGNSLQDLISVQFKKFTFCGE